MRKVIKSVWGCVVCAAGSFAAGQECYQPVQSLSAPGRDFGEAMAVQNDRALITKASLDNAARGYIFERVSGAWVSKTALNPPFVTNNQTTTAALDGDVAVMGAPSARVSGLSSSGVVYVFRRESETSWPLEAQLNRDPPSPGSPLAGRLPFAAT